jgi:hypothetical protein
MTQYKFVIRIKAHTRSDVVKSFTFLKGELKLKKTSSLLVLQ